MDFKEALKRAAADEHYAMLKRDYDLLKMTSDEDIAILRATVKLLADENHGLAQLGTLERLQIGNLNARVQRAEAEAERLAERLNGGSYTNSGCTIFFPLSAKEHAEHYQALSNSVSETMDAEERARQAEAVLKVEVLESALRGLVSCWSQGFMNLTVNWLDDMPLYSTTPPLNRLTIGAVRQAYKALSMSWGTTSDGKEDAK